MQVGSVKKKRNVENNACGGRQPVRQYSYYKGSKKGNQKSIKADNMKNYLIYKKESGVAVAVGLAENKRDAQKKTGCLSHKKYSVIEAHAEGINYQPIKRH